MKFGKDETNMSHLVQSKGILGSNSYVSYNNNYRPISAATKRPGTGIGVRVNSAKKQSNDFPLVGKGISQISHNYSQVSQNVEKEKLYEETLQLKTQINNLKRELAASKSENHKKELEINKKDKVIEDIAADSGIYSGTGSSDNMLAKAKDTTLIIKMKKQYKDLKKEFRTKCEEVEELKKLSKITKFNEFNIEIKTLTEELNKVKTLYSHSLLQHEMNENNMRDLQILQENFSKQHFIIISLQEALAKSNEDVKIRDEEINKLRNSQNERTEVIKKMKRDLQFSTQVNEKLSKEKREPNSEVNSLKMRYEATISELNGEIKRNREIADRYQRQVRELESQMKRMSQGNSTSNFKASTFNYNEIKYIQDNPEDKYDNITLLLKSKLQEQVTQKENLKKHNLILAKKVKFYEKQLGYQIKDEDVKDMNDLSSEEESKVNKAGVSAKSKSSGGVNVASSSDRKSVEDKEESQINHKNIMTPSQTNFFTEDQLTEFTYILIKNFEAKKMSYIEAEEIILKNISGVGKSTTDSDSIINKLCNNIYSILKVTHEDDKKKIKIYLNTILHYSDSNLETFLDKIKSLFYNVKIYKDEEEIKLKTKLKKHLKDHSEYLRNLLVGNDSDKSGLVTFLNLRKILESINLRLKDKYIEYLIYTMKSFNDKSNASIYDLKYEVMFNIIKEAPEDSKLDSSEEEDNNEELNEEDSEIVITTDQFNEKVNTFLRKLKEFLKSSKLSMKGLLKDKIFKPSQADKQMADFTDDCVLLKDFLQEMNRINVNLTNLEVYCIYTKFKILDDYEAISVDIIERELEKNSPGELGNRDAGNDDVLPHVTENEEDESKYSFDENDLDKEF